MIRLLDWVRFLDPVPVPPHSTHSKMHVRDADGYTITDCGCDTSVTVEYSGKLYEYGSAVVAAREVLTTSGEQTDGATCMATGSTTTPSGGQPKTKQSKRVTSSKPRVPLTKRRVKGRKPT